MAKKPQKKKFWEVEIPLIDEKYEVSAYALEDLDGKSIKMDLTRRLRGKGTDVMFKIKVSNDKAVAEPKKLVLQSFFIRHMLRKSISYVEDSFSAESQNSKIIIKPFLITRKKVSRAVRKTLRNSAKNWLVDYAKEKSDSQLFEEIMRGELQKPLSLKLKKIYPLALCEIRILEIQQPLKKDKKVEKEKEEEKPVEAEKKEEAPEKKKTAKKVTKETTKKTTTKKTTTKKEVEEKEEK